jgi:hypothetical protein
MMLDRTESLKRVLDAEERRERERGFSTTKLAEVVDMRIGAISGRVPDRSRIAPLAIDGPTLRAWFRGADTIRVWMRAWTRGADLKAPKWKTAAICWPDVSPYRYPPPSPLMARYSVSAASVDRATARAAAPRPRQVEPKHEGPKVEAIDYSITVDMLLDGLLDETGVATSRRAYTAEDTTMLARWGRGQFSQIKYDAGPFWVDIGKRAHIEERGLDERGLLSNVELDAGLLTARTDPPGSDDVYKGLREWMRAGALDPSRVLTVKKERRKERDDAFYTSRKIHRHPDRTITDQDLDGAFGVMLYWANRINALIPNRCNAKTPTGRAYQAAIAIRDYHRLRRGIGQLDIIAADIVIEAVSAHLRRPGKIGWMQRTATLDMLEGASSHEAGDRFGRDPSSLRERYNAETLAIEARFGRYCNEIWQPPQRPSATCHNISIGRISAKPFLRPLDAEARAQFVDTYRALASAPLLDGFASRCCWLDPIEGLAAQALLRQAYRVIADYIEASGRILICPLGLAAARWSAPWHVDRRSDASVAESFTGSSYREPGLELNPLDPKIARQMKAYAVAVEGSPF